MSRTAGIAAVTANRSESMPSTPHEDQETDRLLPQSHPHPHARPDEMPAQGRRGSAKLLARIAIAAFVLFVIFLAAKLLRFEAGVSSIRYDNGLAQRPTMGWNSWNRYGCEINETVILAAARSLKSTGLADLGYDYVNIDDCWQLVDRDENGDLVPDPKTFPSGIRKLADEVHELGLKLGIYSSAGTKTCAGRAASLNYEQQDARLFASWGIDLLKYDNCYNQGIEGTAKKSFGRYAAMARALNETGRPINYALCSWGEDKVETWAPQIANSWRTTLDIWDGDHSKKDDHVHLYYVDILDKSVAAIRRSGPGAFADLDMLEVGNGGMSSAHYRSHFTMWAIVKSPLILGNDLTAMDEETKRIIANRHLISVNQDSRGIAATRVSTDPAGDAALSWWSGPLSGGRYVVALLNTSPVAQDDVSIRLDSLLAVSPDAGFQFFDLWQDRKHVGDFNHRFSASVGGHDVAAFEVVPL